MTMTIASSLDCRSNDFKANAAAMQALVDDLRQKVAKIAEGGGADAVLAACGSATVAV